MADISFTINSCVKLVPNVPFCTELLAYTAKCTQHQNYGALKVFFSNKQTSAIFVFEHEWLHASKSWCVELTSSKVEEANFVLIISVHNECQTTYLVVASMGEIF